MSDRGFLCLLVIFLGFSCLVFAAAAVPDTSPLLLSSLLGNPDLDKADHPSSLPFSLHQGEALDMSHGGELARFEEDAFVEGRMDLETNDYGGAGANRDHEPKTPGSG